MTKIPEGRDHVSDMEETFESVQKFNMKLNLDKCTLGIPTRKIMGFMLTHRKIEANPDKF